MAAEGNERAGATGQQAGGERELQEAPRLGPSQSHQGRLQKPGPRGAKGRPSTSHEPWSGGSSEPSASTGTSEQFPLAPLPRAPPPRSRTHKRLTSNGPHVDSDMWILVVWPPRDPQWSTGGFRGLASHRPNPSEPEGPSGPVSPSSRDLMNLALPESSMTGQRRVGQTGALANTRGGVLGEPPYPATGCSHMHNLLSEAHRAGPTLCGSKGPKRATERTGGLEGMWRMTPRWEGGRLAPSIQLRAREKCRNTDRQPQHGRKTHLRGPEPQRPHDKETRPETLCGGHGVNLGRSLLCFPHQILPQEKPCHEAPETTEPQANCAQHRHQGMTVTPVTRPRPFAGR